MHFLSRVPMLAFALKVWAGVPVNRLKWGLIVFRSDMFLQSCRSLDLIKHDDEAC